MSPTLHLVSYSLFSGSVQSTNVPAHHLALSNWKIHDVDSLWKWLSKFIAGFPLVLLPLKVRKMVFKAVFEEQVWFGKSVPLVTALRPHKDLYREALDVFFKQETSVYRLWIGNLNRSLGMGKSGAKGIQRLEISCGVVTISQIKKIFNRDATFTHVMLKFNFTKQEVENSLITWITTILRISPHVRSLSVRYPAHFGTIIVPSLREVYDAELTKYNTVYEQWKRKKRWGYYNDRPIEPEKPRSLTTQISDRLGVKASKYVEWCYACPKFTWQGDALREIKRFNEYDHEERLITWEVGVGHVLFWTEEEYEGEEMTG